MHRNLTVLVLMCLAASTAAGAESSSAGQSRQKADEVRAVWVTRWDYRSPHDVRTAVVNCASIGLDRIYFQVRGQGDAFYRSSFEPWGEELGGDPERDGDPGFDPLATAIRAAREQRLELHAWVNLLPGWKGARKPRSEKHVVHTHPEWFLTDRKGRRALCREDRYTLLNPCLPQVRSYLASVVGDIAARYDVDGIQLDYVRFLERDPKKGEDVPYDAPTLASFRRLHGGSPSQLPERWDRFRMSCMDQLVRDVAAAVRRERPRARLSVAAFQDRARAREALFQDAARWRRRGWIDEVCPMLYTTSLKRFRSLVSDWKRAVPGADLVAGVGIYRMTEIDQARAQIAETRAASLEGFALFSYHSCFLSRSPHSKTDSRSAEIRARMRKAVAIATR